MFTLTLIFSLCNNGDPAIHYTDSILVGQCCAAVSGINSIDMHRHGKFSLSIFSVLFSYLIYIGVSLIIHVPCNLFNLF